MIAVRIVNCLLISLVVLQEVCGHGMMVDPINRSSIWRFNDSFPINYDDNAHFCGGFEAQWGVNEGKCGVCGDNYKDSVPRKNENTGIYGLGYIVAEYKSGSVIEITVVLFANHRGWFTYSICNIKDPSQPEHEDCFQNLQFVDGSYEFKIQPTAAYIKSKVILPKGLVCKRCVLRWHYHTALELGLCNDGTEAMGCGPQETFRSCADIAIV